MMKILVQKLKEHIIELPQIVLDSAIAVYVYGSVARGDNDCNSDCDVFIPIYDCSDLHYNLIKESTCGWHSDLKCEFAFYQLSALKKMSEKGSYFLWHIKTEGIKLYQKESGFDALLENLPQYGGTADDFSDYVEILNDVAISLTQSSSTIKYELSVLATLARNICIGCCYLSKTPDFGRRTPIYRCMDVWKERFPFSISEYDELYEYRIVTTRDNNLICRNTTIEYVSDWVEKIDTLLQLALAL